jgi:hypothetical protein
MATLTGPALIAAYKGKLASSGLTPKEGEKLALEPVPADEAARLGYKKHAAMRIPYFDPAGNIKDFERVRYLEDTRTNMERVMKKKERRYDQLKGTGVDAYLPPLMKQPWGLILRDPTVPLVVTEGELKAACATKHGVPTIGLGGVWNFANPIDKVELIEALEITLWEDRIVYIVYDSDAATNTKVLAAENRFAGYLLDRAAVPLIVRMPNVLGDNAKTGVDDFIISQGIEEFKGLLEEGDEFATSKALRSFNEEVVYIREEKTFVSLAKSIRMGLTEFKTHYAPRKYTGMDKDGDPVVKPLVPAWIEWPFRRELDHTTYVPEGDRVIDGALNSWLEWGCVPKAGDVKPWLDLLDFIFSSDPDPVEGKAKRVWFERWCAYPIQHPGIKMHSAALFVGGSGVGKTLTFDILAKIYGANSTTINNKHFATEHNTWAERKQFIIGNEVIVSTEKFETAELLKEIITREVVRINPKFINEYEIPDCINYGFTTNKPHALPLEDDDRRYFIHRVPSRPHPKGREFYDRIVNWMKSEDGPPALFHYLLNLDLGDFDPFGPAMETIAKEEMKFHGRSEMADWVHTLKYYPDDVTRVGAKLRAWSLFTSEELLAFFKAQRADEGPNSKFTAIGLGRELAAQGFASAVQGRQVRCHDGKQRRLWIVRDVEKVAGYDVTRIAALYRTERGDPGTPKRRKI